MQVKGASHRTAAALLISMAASVGSILLYVLVLYYVSGYYNFVPYARTFDIALAFRPLSPRPVLNAIFTGLLAVTAGVMAWNWASRRLLMAGPSCCVGLAALFPSLSLCCSPLLLFLATSAGLFGAITLQAFREISLTLIIFQVLLIKAVIDVSQRPETPSLRAVLARRQNVLLLVLLVDLALGYELWLSLVFPYLF